MMYNQNTRRGFTQSCFSKGFTLIELLVVVLIIGILAAVAVPQYQMAVAKSRFATLKEMTKALANAEELYYLANGTYTEFFDKLDVDTPAGLEDTLEEGSKTTRTFDWGNCYVGVNSVQCSNNKMAYQVRFEHAGSYPKQTWCIAWNTDVNSIENKVCKIDTQSSTYDKKTSSYIRWIY